MSAFIDDLEQSVMLKAVHALIELKENDIPVVVTSTRRSEAEQYAYWLQGRADLETVNEARLKANMRPIMEAENRSVITHCDGKTVKSRHQGGRALDVVPCKNGNPVWPRKSDRRWYQISSVFKSYGFEWGGDWQFWDPAHYEM